MLTIENVVAFGKKVATLSGVRGVAVTKLDIPKPNEGDVDMMVYCDSVPTPKERKALYLGEIPLFCGERWGEGDRVVLEGVEVYLMYFTMEAAEADITSILCGSRKSKEDGGFYTTGRLAMYKNLVPIADDGCVAKLKAMAKDYPEKMRQRILRDCRNVLNETENFERAVVRGEVLLYHVALEDALDAFLQALFAVNHVLFPSRKRSLQYIKDFTIKPDNVEKRLLFAVKFGAESETLAESYEIWKKLVEDLNL